MLAAGVAVAWLRLRGHRAASRRTRRSLLGWTIALALLALSVLSSLAFTYDPYAWAPRPEWLVVIAAAVAAVLAIRPALARRVVPPGMILLGLAGLVLERGFTSPGGAAGPGALRLGWQAISWYGAWSGTVSRAVLAQAYVLVLAGGWLTWRSADPVLARGRRLLGGVSELAPWAALRALLLLPAAVMAAEIFIPSAIASPGPVAAWFALFLAGAVLVLKRWPGAASRLAAAGWLALGLAGVVLMLAHYDVGSPVQYGVEVVAPPVYYGFSPVLVVPQFIALLALGAVLVPLSFPAAGRLLRLPADPELARRVETLTQSRAVAVDTAASDLRRLERDLHDGAQVRLVALGMNLRAAERLIGSDPAAAAALVAEARQASARALTELRELVRGVHPPVLADRGLADAVRALALDCPLQTEVEVDLPGRVAAPVETACYFAVAELLANAAKHSGARAARVEVSHEGGVLRVAVTDFGLGGADPAAGSGLAGVEKRLAAFDGIMAVSSPPGGPTIVVLEVPCALSSAKISSC